MELIILPAAVVRNLAKSAVLAPGLLPKEEVSKHDRLEKFMV